MITEGKTLFDTFTEFIYSVENEVDCYMLYQSEEKIYKLQYIFSSPSTQTLSQYWYINELNNSARLIYKIEEDNAYKISNVLKQWYADNKSKITIIEKRNAKIFLSNNRSITESNTQWKTLHQLRKNIENGLEVPNIPDEAYKLNELQVFINKKNRELIYKYKQAFEWLQDVVADGDKEYAEKLMKIVEKWKREYENKIRSAKSVLREEIFEGDMETQIKNARSKAKLSYSYYTNYLEDWAEPYKSSYLKRLENWYATTMHYLDNAEERVRNGDGEIFTIEYESFGLDNIDELFKIPNIKNILESSERVQSEIRRFIKNEDEVKRGLQHLKNNKEYQSASPKQKQEMIDKLLNRFVRK